MARKNPRIKVKDVKELYYSYNKDNQLEYFVRFKPKNTNPFPIVNYTQIFNLYDLDDKKHLKEVIELRDYTHSKWKNENIYYIDEVTGKLKAEEEKLKEAVEQKKIDVLFGTIFEVTLNNLNIVESTRKPYVANYNRHIKRYLGAISVYDIKYKDVEAIFDRMDNEDENGTGKHILHKKSGKVIMRNDKKKLSLATKKNVLTIFRNVFKYLNEDEDEYADFHFDPSARILRKLKDDFKKDTETVAYAPLNHRVQLSSTEKMLNIVRKTYQEINKMVQVAYKKDGTKKLIPSDRQRTQAYFYTSLMTARRISELQKIKQSMIDEDVVFVNPKTSKTKIYDEYILPSEVMNIINSTQDEYPFKIAYGTANRNWHIIKSAIEMKDTELRQYDFRHLFVSIMSEHYDRETLGLCISHRSGDDVKSNEHYFALVLGRKREVFEKYWELIREPIS